MTTSGIVLYWRPGCPYCTWLRRGLRAKHLTFTETDIWSSPEAAAFVRSVADGNETVPTVTVNRHAMVNPSATEVLSAVAEHAPALLPAPRPKSWWRRLRRSRTSRPEDGQHQP
ncbi:glutaredoxin domain-containing protein [Streptomyces rubellomurinus]|uniref:glutaredoxin domain-containing protein n=1 Tax=Streptomyces rubellomurinus (strain ATCC 31215) TaxID=359131 RepID=UPI0005F1EAF0|nr:glutaredoxin domain-containing protein [Streptomyces rubellomurinus]